MSFLEFENLAQYTSWHDREKTTRGYPIIGRRLSDGVLQPDKQQTVSYSDPIEHPDKDSRGDDRIIAAIDRTADTIGETEITEEEARGKGWIL